MAKNEEKDPMAKIEKMNDGSMSGLTKTIIGTIGTIVAAGGTFLISFMNGKKEEKSAAPTIIVNPSQPQAPATQTKTVVIKEKAASSEKKEEKKEEVKPRPKHDGDEFKDKETKW